MAAALLLAAGFARPVTAQEAQPPNILVVWGEEIGQSDISAYTMGLVGYRTPNIDRIAKEGMILATKITGGKSGMSLQGTSPK